MRILPIALATLTAAAVNAGPATDYKISGPYTSNNLSIYLVHASEKTSGKTYMTLDEALEHRLVIVYETSDVNTLLIANISKDEVYIQSGDIVKGGKQDRVVKEDMILPEMSGKVQIQVFCVEHGRWTQRGSESAGHFESSKQSISGNAMKIAVRSDGDQREVWSKVAEAQDRLEKNIAAPVKSRQSESSFQLTLESQHVRESTKPYEDALSPLIDRHRDAVGYVVAINGKVTSADVYANHSLFRKLWPKLISSAAVEAVGADKTEAIPPAPSQDEIKSVVAGPKDLQLAADQKVNARTEVRKKESDHAVLFETRDAGATPGAAAVHRSYVVK
jgi:hypothetical protein